MGRDVIGQRGRGDLNLPGGVNRGRHGKGYGERAYYRYWDKCWGGYGVLVVVIVVMFVVLGVVTFVVVVIVIVFVECSSCLVVGVRGCCRSRCRVVVVVDVVVVVVAVVVVLVRIHCQVVVYVVV